jgi:hypothetical protein
MTEKLQNDPDRAGGLVSDAQGEFVAGRPGGVFDPRAFRADEDGPDGDGLGGAEPGELDVPVDKPPVDDQRMSGPGQEIDKTG